MMMGLYEQILFSRIDIITVIHGCDSQITTHLQTTTDISILLQYLPTPPTHDDATTTLVIIINYPINNN